MDRSNKKRIARIGHIASKDKINPMSDFVADIMKTMDVNITDSECFKTFGSPTYSKGTDQSNLQIPPAISTHPNIAPQQQKKFLPTKRHPLMEKAQKSKNYIKHNRSIPKPRAHLGGLEDSVRSKRNIDIKRNFSSNHLEEKRKPSGISTKRQHSKLNNASIALSNKRVNDIKSKSRISSSDSEFESFTQAQKLDTDSNSESEFESFIQAQKLEADWDEQNSTKKKSKPKTDDRKRTKLSKKKYTKNKRMKSVELENEDNNSLPCSNISSKFTTTNRLTLPETSDSSVSSADESKSTNSLFEAEKTSSVPSFEKENRIESCRQIDTDSSMCTVRIERNPLLDEVFELNPLKDIKNYEFSSQLEGSIKIDLTECKEKTAVDSDDDCLIVCEFPNSQNHFDTCITEGVNTVSDIQILNVISIGQNEKAIDMNEENTVSVTQSSSLDENSCGVNFENSKEVIEHGSNFSTLMDETFITELNNANISENRFQVVTDCNFNEKSCPPVSLNILDAINKIDLKQVLLLASNADSKSSHDIKLIDSLPCSSSCTDLPSKKPEIITEDHWLNLQKAVNMNNCSTNEPTVLEQLKVGRLDFNHRKSENITNCIENVSAHSKEPSSIVSDCNISAPSLKEIITIAEQLTSGGNILPDKDTRGLQLKKDSYVDPCDELDDFVAARIQEFWPNESPQNISQLLHIYSKVLQEYNKIKNSEKSITHSLKVLQESKEEKKKHLETVLKLLMKYDPCFYTTAKSSQDTIECNDKACSVKNTENEDISSYQIKSCVNCGSKATILCDNCKKVYFCSTDCGVVYWNNGHYKTCEGLRY